MGLVRFLLGVCIDGWATKGYRAMACGLTLPAAVLPLLLSPFLFLTSSGFLDLFSSVFFSSSFRWSFLLSFPFSHLFCVHRFLSAPFHHLFNVPKSFRHQSFPSSRPFSQSFHPYYPPSPSSSFTRHSTLFLHCPRSLPRPSIHSTLHAHFASCPPSLFNASSH